MRALRPELSMSSMRPKRISTRRAVAGSAGIDLVAQQRRGVEVDVAVDE